MAGYRETFGANVDYAYGRGVTDLTSRLNQGISGVSGFGRGLAGFAGQMAQSKRAINDMATEMKLLKREMDAATDPQKFLQLARQMDNAKRSAEKMRKQMMGIPFEAMEKGFKKVLDGLLSFNTGILSIAFGFLTDSIKRVYELQERWTKAIGGFNMKLGGMTKGLQGAQRAAVQWSSTIRGLTNGDINEGIQMFGEFTMAIGRTVKSGDQLSKIGIQIARGFGVGGQGAGQILKVWENIGLGADDAAEAMKTSIKAANQAGIPVNMLAEDLVKSSTYMARFGKESQKTLIQGAAWARKYDISLEQLRASVEGLDAFDEAAKSASKLNTAFGTMINSMDLMMEDDPAKRLDMIRQEMLAQGLTYDKLTPKQRRYFSETLKLSEEQTAALLDAQNANESYTDFAAKAAAKEKKELSAKALMQKQLQATTQTMYAFGMAFDRITVAIGNAIKPLLVVLGLAKDNGKKFGGFGEVMESVTKTVEQFFNSLAKNTKWIGFMKTLANDLIRAGKALKEFVFNGGAANLMGDIADGMKSFYTTVRDLAIKAVPMLRPLMDALFFLSKHIKEIALVWGGLKVFNVGRGLLGSLGGLGGGGLGGGILGKVGGRLGMAGAAGAVGGMIGGKGAGIGASIGSLAGGFFGPMGMILGPIVGGLAGKAISWIFGSSRVKTELELAHEDLEKTIRRETEKREQFTAVLEVAQGQTKAHDKIRMSNNEILAEMEKAAIKQKGKTLELNDREAEMLRTRADELMKFGKFTKVSKEQLMGLSGGSKLTAAQLHELVIGSQNYEGELQKLRDLTQKQADLEMARLQSSSLGQQKEALELTTKLRDAELKAAKSELKDLGGGTGALYTTNGIVTDNAMSRDSRGMTPEEKKAFFQTQIDRGIGPKDFWQKQIKRAELESKINKLDMDNVMDKKDLVRRETEFLKQQTIIQLKTAIRSDAAFLNFQSTAAERGKSIDEQTLDFLNSGQSVLGNNPEVRALLAEGVNISGVVGPRGPAMAGPSPLSNPFGTPVGLSTNTGAGGFMVTSTVADVKMDGKKVGRAMVSTSLQAPGLMYGNQ